MVSASSLKSLILDLLKKWFGPFTKEEFKKYALLGVIFSLIIGTYWTLRPLKDAIFGTIVGKGSYLAIAKIVSMLILFPVVAIYGKLVGHFKRKQMFYFMCAMYATLMVFWGIIFSLPEIGLSNTVASPTRIIGWLWYTFVESFGSLMVALFWAFTTDISDAKSAKYGIPLAALIGQLGGIVGPYYLSRIPVMLGTTTAPLVALCSILVMLTAVMISLFLKIIPKDQMQGFKAKEPVKEKVEKTGFLDGIKLMMEHKYLLGIFAVLGIFEIIGTFIDFNFKTMVIETFATDVARNVYLSGWGTYVNIATFLCLLFGISNIQRWLGVRFALALTPFLLFFSVLTFRFYNHLDILFWLVVISKAINYALNAPTVKQLYIPTTKDTKYKAQAWVETFGSRSAKAASSGVNAFKNVMAIDAYLTLILFLSCGLLASWIFIALKLGSTYNKAVRKNVAVC